MRKRIQALALSMSYLIQPTPDQVPVLADKRRQIRDRAQCHQVQLVGRYVGADEVVCERPCQLVGNSNARQVLVRVLITCLFQDSQSQELAEAARPPGDDDR